MRFRLRTLLIVLALGPPVLAPGVLWGWREFVAWRKSQMPAVQPPEKGYLGVEFVDAEGGGLKVTLVRPGCAAEASGVMPGDVITAVSNQPSNRLNQSSGIVNNATVGTSLTLTLNRDGQQMTVTATLRRQPAAPWIAPPQRISVDQAAKLHPQPLAP